MVVLVLAVCGSAIGVLCTCAWFRSGSSVRPRENQSSDKAREDVGDREPGTPESVISTPLRRRRVDTVQFSPTVNITVRTEAVDVGWRIAELQGTSGSGDSGQSRNSEHRQVRMPRNPVEPPCGLVPARTLDEDAREEPCNPVGPGGVKKGAMRPSRPPLVS